MKKKSQRTHGLDCGCGFDCDCEYYDPEIHGPIYDENGNILYEDEGDEWKNVSYEDEDEDEIGSEANG